MITDKVRAFILSEVWMDGKPEELGDDTQLIERGILDSLGIWNLVSFIEEEWAVTVKDEELIPEHFGTISRIAGLVEAKSSVRRDP
jgi:acyl carrier protein